MLESPLKLSKLANPKLVIMSHPFFLIETTIKAPTHIFLLLLLSRNNPGASACRAPCVSYFCGTVCMNVFLYDGHFHVCVSYHS